MSSELPARVTRRSPSRSPRSLRRRRATGKRRGRRSPLTLLAGRTQRDEDRAAGVHVVGIALARYIVLVEPVASMSVSEVIEIVAPTFQRYLVEPLQG